MVSAWWLIVLVAAVPLTSSTQGAHIFQRDIGGGRRTGTGGFNRRTQSHSGEEERAGARRARAEGHCSESSLLCAAGADELGYCRCREPKRVDDAQMFELAIGAGVA